MRKFQIAWISKIYIRENCSACKFWFYSKHGIFEMLKDKACSGFPKTTQLLGISDLRAIFLINY